uniref:Uncharacterized protein n=1 Tax=Seriola lalandi dorsalis TaxID=1841481 RepID=A0A3B4WDJ1_SERLL
YYLVSFSRLGNTENPCSLRRGQEAPGSLLVADWGGTEGIGAELLEIQRQVERLSDPSCPESVGRLLQQRRQVLLLQFDTAVRHLIRSAFLSSGDVASYQSVSDNMAAALPLLSDIIQTDVFSLTLPVPRPLETRGRQAQTMYSWRSFISCHGLFPLRVWDIPSIEYCMQVQLIICRLTFLFFLANAWFVYCVLSWFQGDENCLEAEVEEETTCVSDSSPPLQDLVRVQSVLKGFLLLTKQLQVFKESWARRRLGPDIFTTPSLYQQFVKLYRYYMRALAQHMGKERGYEVVVSGSQSLLPPPGASEVDVKAWQLHRLLESTECDMIKAVQRRINRELTLVLSERTRQDTCLPTELWKKAPVKYSLSPERPQMVETFIQQLMEGAEQAEGQVGKSHNDAHRLNLSSFPVLTSGFKESEGLSHKQPSHRGGSCNYTTTMSLCRGMMLEISALQARVAHLEEEKRSLEEELGLRFKERYDPLVRQLFSTCIQLKVKRQLPATDNKLLMDYYYYHNGCSQTEELQAARHQSAQESRSRQEVDSYRVQSLEQMRADVEERDRQLRALGEQLDRGGRMNQLQRRHSTKQIRQVKGQLHQERCLKQEAFEQVAKLKNHVNDMEAAFSRCTTGTHSQSDGVSRASVDTSDQQSTLSSETFSICFNQFDLTFHSSLSLYLLFLRPKQDLLHAVSQQIEH